VKEGIRHIRDSPSKKQTGGPDLVQKTATRVGITAGQEPETFPRTARKSKPEKIAREGSGLRLQEGE